MSKISDNGKKKVDRTRTISDSDILVMYEAIVPLLSNNPEGLSISDQVNKRLLKFVHYDFDHGVMADPQPNRLHGKLNLLYEKWERFGSDDDTPSISMPSTTKKNADEIFEETVERNFQSAIARSEARYPEIREYHYQRIESKTYPRIVIGFFRRKDSRSNNNFTREEKNIFKQLAPHIFALYRAVLTQIYHSEAFQYFNAFANLGSKLAKNYSLSDSEAKLIPDILFGYNNEEIAEKNFISIETVKSHIKHILKKTRTKNRVDFISKFFTSPQRVQL